MLPTAKMLILVGVALMVAGVALWVVARLGFRGLPGDIRYQGQHTTFYFPVVTCIVLSVLLTLGWWLWQWISRR